MARDAKLQRLVETVIGQMTRRELEALSVVEILIELNSGDSPTLQTEIDVLIAKNTASVYHSCALLCAVLLQDK